MNDHANAAALSVPCQQCGARRLEPCRSPKPYHVSRAQRGLAKARTDEHLPMSIAPTNAPGGPSTV
jgi:hypothetical protein